ncbi:hypothetical protein Ndes2437B_g05513 [Nannochloris sp. 'desiccata']
MQSMPGVKGRLFLGSANKAAIANIRNTCLAARPKKNSIKIQAAISFNAAPPEVLIAGGALVISTAGFLIFEAIKASKQLPAEAPQIVTPKAAPLPRENAVLVFGASGRTGRQVVAELLKAGRTVVAAVRDENRAAEAFAPLGISPGRQQSPSEGVLFLQTGIDVTDDSTLATPDLFKGVTQIICTLGPVFGRTAEGTIGYLDNMTSQRVDDQGVSNIAAAAAKYFNKGNFTTNGLSSRPKPTIEDILPMKTVEDLEKWQRLDDVIMGGNSSSGLELSPDGTGAVWKGQLIVEGGGFCGARTYPTAMDLSKYDGVSLRVKGDGQTLKLNIKTDTFSEPEDTYQGTFDVGVNGDWTTVFLPWHEFIPVKRARSLPGGPPLDPSKVRQFGLVYSRFAFNGFPNDSYSPGLFEIQFEGGIRGFMAPKPQIVLISSAGVERNAKIGDDEEARKKDIPIVQLNPGGTLNHKYSGENAVRSSGLSYTVIRPTGMSDDAAEQGPALLEASQGDRISGKVARSEIAALAAAATGMAAATNKTIEIRRSEAGDAQGKAMGRAETLKLFLEAVQDRCRAQIGLEPFPTPAAPPAAPTEERKAEILADPRVKATQERNAGGRVRSEEESEGAKTVTAAADGRAEASPSSASSDGEEQVNTKSRELPGNVADAREWIRRWRAKNFERQLPQDVASKAPGK